MSQGLTFAAWLRYTGRGHKNRGAVRLRSALSGVPFNLIRQCRRREFAELSGTINKPPCVCYRQAHFVFVYYRSEKRNPYDQNLFQDPHSGGGRTDDRSVHRFEHDPDPAHAPRGSITLFSMVPILVMSYRHGAKWGVMTAFVNSLIQLVQGLGNLAYCQTLTAQVGCVLLDYLLAFTVLGFAA